MRFVRPFLVFLIILIVLVLAAAFSPIVQTWLVNRALARHGIKGSVGSVWAGISSVELSNVRLEHEGVILAVPELDATLPVTTALWSRKLLVSHLVAKGWTIDMSQQPTSTASEAGAATEPTSPSKSGTSSEAETKTAPNARRGFRGVLDGWSLPMEASLDGIELEGDLLLRLPSVAQPVRAHTVLIGGGFAPGKSANLSLDASGTPANSTLRLQTSAAHGQLEIAVAPTRELARIQFVGRVSSEDESLPKDCRLAATIDAAHGGASETYGLALTRGDRTIASVSAHFEPKTSRFAGNWKLDLQGNEVPLFLPDHALPTLSVVGDGEFDSAPTFVDVHAAGHLRGTAADWASLASALQHIGPTTFDITFDGSRAGHSVRVDRCEGSLAAPKPVARFQSAQRFSLDFTTGGIRPVEPSADWLRGSLMNFPVGWLPRLVESIALDRGVINGDFALRATPSEWSVRSLAPVTARNVSVMRGDKIVGQDLDVTTMLLGTFTQEKGWKLHGDALAVQGGGRRIATGDATLTPLKEPYRTVSVSGNLNIDLDALASQPGAAGVSWVQGHSATADFTANLGTAADFTAHVHVVGHDPKVSLTATIGANIDDYRSVTFRVPLSMVSESKLSQLSIDGTWAEQPHAHQIDVAITGGRVEADHLQRLAGALRLANGMSLPAMLTSVIQPSSAPPARRDDQPFWGDLVGRLRVEFHELELGGRKLNEVAATVGFAPDALRLNGGRASFSPIDPSKVRRREDMNTPVEPNSVYSAQGSLSFDPAAPAPYRLNANGSVDVLDTSRLLGKPPAEHEPVVEGRWAVAATITGNGATLPDLVARRRAEFQLTSTGGTLRLLKTNVADALPDAPTPVSDTAVKVGSAVGWLFGVKRDAFNTENHLSQQTEAVLNFTYGIGEIAFDHAVVDAVIGADHAIHLTQITISAPNERLSGTGEMTYADAPLGARPLILDLKLGVRGVNAERLASTGLLEPVKDPDGYTRFREAVRFSGTLDEINNAQWHDLLAQAAARAFAKDKKK